ncbi:MAG TPA: 1-(5-phosphoribosyl)-5-[(5-phosphoribosylamino)methylideneamino]imidazole-4-carboxamide isomerase [Thermodesulfobacteriota bacterium]|nr:1-(5-phosphoribosyl)-5-[(5-phosphoribosylamino)methylideneamino]imidazole-4-carboxamide isomerase [Thermodesulfobacteriota bacterium]
MIIIPAIDISKGKCVRLFQGDYGKETVYGDNPGEMARKWVAEGAQFLHLVDLDGAREGEPRNLKVIQAIARECPIPVEVGGGIRDISVAEEYFTSGVFRIILGTAAYANPPFLKEACARWPGRIAADIAARKGIAAVSGWTRPTEREAVGLALDCEAAGAAAIVYTDIQRDGAQTGVNIEDTRKMAKAVKIPVIASGGVSILADIAALLPLEKDGVAGVIVGRALYAGTIDLARAMAVAAGKGA